VAIGVFADEAFSFYYPENLESLEAAGVRLVPLAPARDRELPDVDGLYIGGGFPEVYATRLADNREFARQVRSRAAAGLPIYAECGGLMYLARELVVDGAAYPMAGVLDLVVEQCARPQGHGYVAAAVECSNPFFTRGSELRGHEFHYSRVVAGRDLDRSVLALTRGSGLGGGRDGLVKGRVWASYLHLHAAGTADWAAGFLELALTYATERSSARAAWA
jgi:cobyrinic acid a,c-diamide synthase